MTLLCTFGVQHGPVLSLSVQHSPLRSLGIQHSSIVSSQRPSFRFLGIRLALSGPFVSSTAPSCPSASGTAPSCPFGIQHSPVVSLGIWPGPDMSPLLSGRALSWPFGVQHCPVVSLAVHTATLHCIPSASGTSLSCSLASSTAPLCPRAYSFLFGNLASSWTSRLDPAKLLFPQHSGELCACQP